MQETKHHLGHLNQTFANLSLILAALVMPLKSRAEPPPIKPRYKLIDLGTFGGPFSAAAELQETVNNRGTVIGVADTAVPDPFAPNCFGPNCLVQHAFQWRDGVLTDLGALAEGVSSFANEMRSEERR